jgi:hypothetical protein
MGDIEMTRRRGTFVKYVRQDRDSRKMQAMAAIDRMIRQLTELNFSPAEIHIFVSLKMREWGMKWSGVRIAVVTEYMDMARLLENQLSHIGNAEVVVWSAKQVRDYPYNLDEQSDVILVSPENAQWLETAISDRGKIIRVAFGMKRESQIALAGAAGRIAVLTGDESTMALVRGHSPMDNRREIVPCTKPAESPETVYDWIAVPEHMENVPDEYADLIGAFRRSRRIIPVSYAIDDGSMIYLEERIARIREERQIHPAGSEFWGEAEEMKKLSALRREPV